MPRPGFDTPITIERLTATSTDSEGRVTETFGAPIAIPLAGVGMADFSEQQVASTEGVEFDAVVLVDHGTEIDAGDRITIDSTPPLAGVYRTTVVRWNPLHLRALVRRQEP